MPQDGNVNFSTEAELRVGRMLYDKHARNGAGGKLSYAKLRIVEAEYMHLAEQNKLQPKTGMQSWLLPKSISIIQKHFKVLDKARQVATAQEFTRQEGTRSLFS